MVNAERARGLSLTTSTSLNRISGIQSTGGDIWENKGYFHNIYDYSCKHDIATYKRLSPTGDALERALHYFDSGISDSMMYIIDKNLKKGDILSVTASLNNVIASIYKSRLYDSEVEVGTISGTTEDWGRLTREYAVIDQVLGGANYERVLLTIADRGIAIKNINNVKEIISNMLGEPEGALELGMALLENYEYKW